MTTSIKTMMESNKPEVADILIEELTKKLEGLEKKHD